MFWKLIGRKIFYSLAAMLGLILWLTTTTSGLITTFWIIKFTIPGTLSATKLEGKWIDKIKIETLNYELPTIQFTTEELIFEPKIVALLDNSFKIPYFQLKNGALIFKDKNIDPLFLNKIHGNFHLNTNLNFTSINIEAIEGSWSTLPLNGYAKIERVGQKNYTSNVLLTLGENQIKILESPNNKQKIDWLFKISHPKINAEFKGFFQKNELTDKSIGQLTLYPGKILFSSSSIKQHSFNYLGGEANFNVDNNNLIIPFNFKQNSQNSIIGKLNTSPLNGSFIAKWNDLSFFNILIPHISKLKGSLNLTGKLEGTIRKPILHLNAHTEKTSFFIPKQGITIKNFNLKISGIVPEELALTGSGLSGDGQFQFSGTSRLNDEFKTTLKITGKNTEIYHTPNIQIIATPEISIDYVNSTFYVQGTVLIPWGEIFLHDEKNHATLSKDIVLVDGSKPSKKMYAFKVIPSLYLIIENQLHFKGYGIDGIIGGKLAIDQRPDGLLSGSGRLTIKEGKYRLQGATRYIHRGYLLFPPGTLLTDPILDIRILQRRVDEQKNSGDVGIYVQGTLQKPFFQPYSTTNLQSTQILSRLGFGGAETAGDENQRQVIAQTAFLLAGSANPLVDFLQTNLGLEEFNIESRETFKGFFTQGGTDTELIIGKSLTDKIYLQYVQSVLNPLTTIRLKYFLSRYFTTSVETGTEGLGMDLTFSMEKD